MVWAYWLIKIHMQLLMMAILIYIHRDICNGKFHRYQYLKIIEKKLRHDKISRQFFVSDLSNLMAILVTILVAKAIPAKKPK